MFKTRLFPAPRMTFSTESAITPARQNISVRIEKAWRAAAAIITVACAQGTTQTLPSRTDPAELRGRTIAIVNARVLTMTDAGVLDGRTVIVRDGVIERIQANDAPRPDDAAVLDAAGRYLMPALVDMHVHLRRADLPAYLAAGIGTVRNMWGHSGIPPLMKEVAANQLLGPRIISTSPGLDGNPPQWPETQIVTTAEEADASVQRQVDAGWRTIKVYQSLSLSSYDAIAAAAKRSRIDFAGHVPTAVPVLHALEMGQRSIEHFSGYDRAVSRQGRLGTWGWIDVDTARFTALARATARTGTWNCPTLTIYAKLAEQHSASERTAVIDNRRRFVRALEREGAPLLAGTDAGIDIVPPGTSLHDELAQFVAAGFSPARVLRAATADAGRFLGIAGLGTIAPGAPADLLLVERDPLADIVNTRAIAGIVLRGDWYSLERLRAQR
jgi:imidazolonepropionase-like amidohydrolase